MFKVYQLKIQKPDASYFGRLFAEAKWWTNEMVATDDLKAFDTKRKAVTVRRGDELESEALTLLSSQMRQQLYKRMWDNIRGLASRKKNGGKVGRLKFRRFVNSIPLSNQTFKFIGNRLKLQCSSKTFRVVGLKQLGSDPDIRSGCLIRKPSGVYLSITIKLADVVTVKCGYVGIDMGVKDALVFNDGTTINFANLDLEFKIKQAHKSISRRKKGSRNRDRAKANLRRLEEKYRNQQNDAVNKLLNKLKPHTVCIQNELLKAWKKRFGKKLQRGILGRLKAKLKLDSATVVLPASEPTTQLCPECGSLNKHGLGERVYRCDCGYTMPRDKHSARNMIFMSGVDNAVVELMLDIGRVLSGIQSVHLTMKQEAHAL